MFNLGSPTGLNNTDHTKDQMHPHDTRNMFIFFILAAFLYFSYDAFILKPQTRALKARAAAKEELLKSHGPDILEGIDKPSALQTIPRDEALSTTSISGGRISFDNGEVFGTIALEGGRIDDLSLREYFKTLDKAEHVSMLSPRGTQYPRRIDYGWISQDTTLSMPNKKTIWSVRGNQNLTKDTPVMLVWNNSQGLIFKRLIELDEHYMFTITQSVQNRTGKEITLYPYGILAQRGLPDKYNWMWISHEGPVAFIGDELHQPYYDTLRDGEEKQEFTAQTGWLGITEKYWLTALIPPQGQSVEYHYTYSGDKEDKDNQGLYQADFRGAPVILQPGQNGESQSRLFVGAKKVMLLQTYEADLNIRNIDLAVDFGWLWFLTYPFFYALHYIGLLVQNMGVAIVLLTLIIRGMASPLTNISYRSFAKMKKVGPQVTALRKKHADDKQAMQKELIEMYSREGVNPMAGCLPILLQIPIFFALYKIFFITIELRHAPFFGWIHDLSAPDPTSLFNLFGLIPWSPPVFLLVGVWPCMMLITMVIQKKLNPPPQDAMQRDMANYMPFIFAFIMSRFASGLVVYWTLSAMIGIVQQIMIMRSLNVPIHLFGQKEEELSEEALEAMVADEEDEEPTEPDPPKKISAPKPKKSKKKK